MIFIWAEYVFKIDVDIWKRSTYTITKFFLQNGGEGENIWQRKVF